MGRGTAAPRPPFIPLPYAPPYSAPPYSAPPHGSFAPPPPPRRRLSPGKIVLLVLGSCVVLAVLAGVAVVAFVTPKEAEHTATIVDPAAAAKALEETRIRQADASFVPIEMQMRQKRIEFNEALGMEKALVARYPYAYAALLARRDGAATALKKDADLGDILVGGFVGLTAQSYCNDHGEECETLDASLQQMKAHEDTLTSEYDVLESQVGHKVRVSNDCPEAVKVKMQISDLIQGDVLAVWTIESGSSSELTHGVPLRTRVATARYALMDVGSDVPFRISSDTMAVNNDLEYLLILPCKT